MEKPGKNITKINFTLKNEYFNNSKTMIKIGYIRRDGDGHNYLIPKEDVDKFDQIYNKASETDSWVDFNNNFKDFRIDGIKKLPVIIDLDEEILNLFNEKYWDLI